MKKTVLLFVLCLGPAFAFAGEPTEASFATPFTEHAVLQRDCKIPIWGFATPGSFVDVTLDREMKSVPVDDKGRWKVEFSPRPAGLGHILRLSAGAKEFKKFEDIAIGDVWICTGQSNMYMSWHGGLTRGREELENDVYWSYRFLHVQENVNANPLDKYPSDIQWQRMTEKTSKLPSACGYFFGAALYKSFEDVPIGLVNASWYGSSPHAWMSAQAVAEADGKSVQPPAEQINYDTHGSAFNAMIRPLFPMALKGVISYIGCADVNNTERYARHMRALVKEWRANFTSQSGELPFYFVQLAPFMDTHTEPVESNWAQMRWTQLQLGETIPNCGTAVILDAGDHKDITPHDKKTPGERLARLALSRTYGRKDLVPCGPVPVVAKVGKVKGNPSVAVAFKYGKELSTSDGGAVKGFELAGADGKFVRVEAKIVKESVVLSVPAGMEPVRVRYAWDDYPDCNLVGAEKLPCGTFELEIGKKPWEETK